MHISRRTRKIIEHYLLAAVALSIHNMYRLVADLHAGWGSTDAAVRIHFSLLSSAKCYKIRGRARATLIAVMKGIHDTPV